MRDAQFDYGAPVRLVRAVRDDEDPIRTLRGVGYALRDG